MSAMKPDEWRYTVNNVHTFYAEEKPPDDAYDEGTLVPLYTLATVRKWLEEEPSVAMKESALNSTFGDFDKLYRAMLSAKLLEMEGGE